MLRWEFERCFKDSKFILTEAAVVERVKSEFGIAVDPDVVIAGLIYEEAGRAALEKIYSEYIQIAEDNKLAIMLMTNTRRCNMERVERSRFKKLDIIKDYTRFLRNLAEGATIPVFVGGLIGCRGDAYSAGESIGYKNALSFHKWQVNKLEEADLDFVFAGILPALDEAMGISELLSYTSYPYIISFMINEYGTLLDGTSIRDAILTIDNSVGRAPLCYMANCIHPYILEKALAAEQNQVEIVQKRFLGLQANASQLQTTLLNNSSRVFTSSDNSLFEYISHLHHMHPLKVYGGCCGTDGFHLRLIAKGMANGFC